MIKEQILKSKLDESVNFVIPTSDGGAQEARYVRREQEYFCCYLSSHSGCNRGCKFCHLTATGQTMYTPAKRGEISVQAINVFRHYKTQTPAHRVHFNFMSRGEPLDNPSINDDDVLSHLASMARTYGLMPRFNISTIMPKSFVGPLEQRFKEIHPVIYYSLYSMNQEWRRTWLPGAMRPSQALMLLNEYQKATGALVVIHGAFIEDENDSTGSIAEMMQAVKRSGLVAKFNIVRYNPFSEDLGQESPYLQEIEWQIERSMPVKVVNRIGMDVMASCGTFVGAEL
jgi:23S rRNA (adenine2503-C2)-methyltransferase